MSWLRTLGALTGLAAGGVVGEAVAEHRDRRRFPPPGQLIQSGSRRLHVVARGQGSPVVVIDASLAAWSSHYRLLATELAGHTRVVTYDRAGLGWSEPADGEATVDAMAADLQRVCEHCAGEDPVVAVGHGLGALVVQLLAVRHLADVVGLVLVDAFPVDFVGTPVLPAPPPGQEHDPEVLHLMGVSRVLGHLRGTDARDPAAALALQRRVRRAIARERDMSISRSAAVALGARFDLPLRVVQSSIPFGAARADDYALRWYQSNQALLERSADAMAYVVRDCDHWIPVHRPEAVAAPVRDLLAKLRRR